MDLKLNIFKFWIGLSLQIVFANSVLNDLYSEGLDAYKNGQYEFAIQNFERILDSDWESTELYYNLGNAQYQIENISGAVWAYEQCLKLDPLNKDAKYNLKLINLKVRDRIDIPEPPLFLKLYWMIKSLLAPNSWVQLWIICLLLIGAFIAIRKILDFPSIKPKGSLLSVGKFF